MTGLVTQEDLASNELLLIEKTVKSVLDQRAEALAELFTNDGNSGNTDRGCNLKVFDQRGNDIGAKGSGFTEENGYKTGDNFYPLGNMNPPKSYYFYNYNVWKNYYYFISKVGQLIKSKTGAPEMSVMAWQLPQGHMSCSYDKIHP